VKSVDSTGDFLANCKNVKLSYYASDSENLTYCQALGNSSRDCMDYTNWGANAELVYETSETGLGASNIKFSSGCGISSNNLEYCYGCVGSSNLFGCVLLKKKEYCIFNKQYTKEEYEQMVPKVKAHMDEMPYTDKLGRVYKYGEYFPPEFSPFAANETALMDFTDMDKEQALKFGLVWREPKESEYKATLEVKDIPDHIDEVKDDVLKEIISCEMCKKVFRIIPQELAFCKKHKIPFPRKCHNCRFKDLTHFRNLPKWYKRSCDCKGVKSKQGIYKNNVLHPNHGVDDCQNTFISTYSPERPEIIYCGSCYVAEIA